jgi:hypothetical protein
LGNASCEKVFRSAKRFYLAGCGSGGGRTRFVRRVVMSLRSSEKTRLAGMATNRVLSEIDTAVGALTDLRSDVNSLGIFTHPLDQQATLAAAREAIERAEKIMRETAWPTQENYDGV